MTILTNTEIVEMKFAYYIEDYNNLKTAFIERIGQYGISDTLKWNAECTINAEYKSMAAIEILQIEDVTIEKLEAWLEDYKRANDTAFESGYFGWGNKAYCVQACRTVKEITIQVKQTIQMMKRSAILSNAHYQALVQFSLDEIGKLFSLRKEEKKEERLKHYQKWVLNELLEGSEFNNRAQALSFYINSLPLENVDNK